MTVLKKTNFAVQFFAGFAFNFKEQHFYNPTKKNQSKIRT